MLLRPLDAPVLCFVAVGLLVLGVRRCLARASGPPWSTAIVLGSGESPIRFSVPSCCAHNDKQVDTRVKCFGSPRSSRGKSTTLCLHRGRFRSTCQPKVAASSVRPRALCFRPILNRTISVGADGVTAHGVGDYTSQLRSRPIVELIGAHDGLLVGLLDVRDATAATPGYHL